MPRLSLSTVTPWITEAALQHPAALCAHLAEHLQLPRAAAQGLLRRLEAAQWLQREGQGRQLRHRPGALRQVVRRYPLAGLQEDLPWLHDVAPVLALPPEVQRIVQHVFTELLNNAIEHSAGTRVTVSVRQTPLQVQVLVSGDGRGVFDTIAQHFQIPDPQLAMLALAKGKLTTQPDRHSGRGLFFASKLADVFDLHANGAGYQQRAWEPEVWHRGRPACASGTSVYAAVCLDTPRTLDAVLRRYSVDGEGYRFDRTVVPLALLTAQHTGLASRAQARRVTERLGRFKQVELDFAGMTEVGHGFVDELFRVFGSHHPQTRLVALNMAPRVSAMVECVREELAPA
jgi:anti-sigma regulatory factor (Ser/Thr protein kinase)